MCFQCFGTACGIQFTPVHSQVPTYPAHSPAQGHCRGSHHNLPPVRAIMQPTGSTGTTFAVANTGNKQNGEETGKWSASFSDISLMTRLSVFIGLCIFSARPFHHSPACSGSRTCKNALCIRQHSSKCPACLLTLTEFVTDHFIPLQDFRSICGFSNVYGFHWL